mmetsp:Transcript_34760/g.85535  ORF Transcript_34760/g.85535 Transcript_34760/m.85535 type:complete len:277 (+) Transcript_34760:1902-2732(+)
MPLKLVTHSTPLGVPCTLRAPLPQLPLVCVAGPPASPLRLVAEPPVTAPPLEAGTVHARLVALTPALLVLAPVLLGVLVHPATPPAGVGLEPLVEESGVTEPPRLRVPPPRDLAAAVTAPLGVTARTPKLLRLGACLPACPLLGVCRAPLLPLACVFEAPLTTPPLPPPAMHVVPIPAHVPPVVLQPPALAMLLICCPQLRVRASPRAPRPRVAHSPGQAPPAPAVEARVRARLLAQAGVAITAPRLLLVLVPRPLLRMRGLPLGPQLRVAETPGF